MADDKHFLHNTALISIFTAVSRIMGLIRDIVCASYFGGGVVWDAFSFAFRVPNLFRRLFGEGALSSAFIPVFTDYLENVGRQEAWKLARIVGTALVLVLLACLLLGESLIFSLALLNDLSPRWQLALALSAVLFPYMLFICSTALAASILQSLRHFAAPALAPILLNACWIAAVLIVAPLVSSQPHTRIFVLAVGIVVAGVFQIALQLGVLHRFGFSWKPLFNLNHPGLQRITKTMAPIVLGMAAFQANVLIDGIIAIGLAAPETTDTFSVFGTTYQYPLQIGANSALYYANRLMQFPLGVFGIALATAIFPTLSSTAAAGKWERFRTTLTDGLGSVLFIGIPAGAGLIVLGSPAVELFFQRGAFTPTMTARTSMVLSSYSLGIWAYCAHQVLGRTFYSLEDSITPMKVAFGIVALNFILNLSLIWWFAAAGLALATAISSTVQCAILYRLLESRTGPAQHRRLLQTLIKTIIATGIMVGVCLVTLHGVSQISWGTPLLRKLLRLLVPMFTGMLVYFSAGAALNVPEMDLVLNTVKSYLSRRT